MPYYEFIVRGDDHDIDADGLEAETGLRWTPLAGTARLDGDLVDGAALHGVIVRVYRLGFDLVALERRSGHHVT